MEAKDIAKSAVVSLDKHKAADIKVIGVTDITSLADYFIIAEGTSSTQVKALSDYVEFELGEQGVKPLRVEGYSWITAPLSSTCFRGRPASSMIWNGCGRTGSSSRSMNSSASRKRTESAGG